MLEVSVGSWLREVNAEVVVSKMVDVAAIVALAPIHLFICTYVLINICCLGKSKLYPHPTSPLQVKLCHLSMHHD
jgi:hypothetical protein